MRRQLMLVNKENMYKDIQIIKREIQLGNRGILVSMIHRKLG